MFALSALAFIQTLSLGSRSEANLQVWNAISADPYQTRFFALQMLALTTFLALLYRYASTERRIRVLVYTVLAIAVVSAVFGILRQSTQQQTGFLLPLLKQNQGYGQFINKNHFAYLMEMAFGLGLGIILGGGVKRDRLMIYLALLRWEPSGSAAIDSLRTSKPRQVSLRPTRCGKVRVETRSGARR
jgi:hypothetical protein